MQHKYTAQLIFNNQPLLIKGGDDLIKLTVLMLNWLENSSGIAHGKIVNNANGETIHRCRKTAIKD